MYAGLWVLAIARKAASYCASVQRPEGKPPERVVSWVRRRKTRGGGGGGGGNAAADRPAAASLRAAPVRAESAWRQAPAGIPWFDKLTMRLLRTARQPSWPITVSPLVSSKLPPRQAALSRVRKTAVVYMNRWRFAITFNASRANFSIQYRMNIIIIRV